MGMQDGTLGGFLIDGVNNMIGTVGYLYAIAGIIGILSASGLLQQVIDGLVHSKLNRSVVGTEVIISVGLMVSSICLGSRQRSRHHHVGPHLPTTWASPRVCTPIAGPT